LDFTKVLTQVVSALDTEGIRYALIGGLAMAARGVQRATLDIDFILLLDDLEQTHRILIALSYPTQGTLWPDSIQRSVKKCFDSPGMLCGSTHPRRCSHSQIIYVQSPPNRLPFPTQKKSTSKASSGNCNSPSRIACFDIPIELTPRLISNFKLCLYAD